MSCDNTDLPVISITKTQVDSKLPCTVCYEEFKMNESALQLPCGHIFHDWCINTWLQRRNTCPNCRSNLYSEEDQDDELFQEESEDVISTISFTEDEQGDIVVSVENSFDSDDFSDYDEDIYLSDMETSGENQELVGSVTFDDTIDLDSEGTFDCSSSPSSVSINITMDIEES